MSQLPPVFYATWVGLVVMASLGIVVTWRRTRDRAERWWLAQVMASASVLLPVAIMLAFVIGWTTDPRSALYGAAAATWYDTWLLLLVGTLGSGVVAGISLFVHREPQLCQATKLATVLAAFASLMVVLDNLPTV